VIISGRLRSDWKMVSSDAQAACEFVRSKPLLDCLYSRFSDCGYAADNPRAVPFAAVLSNPKSCAVPASPLASPAAADLCLLGNTPRKSGLPQWVAFSSDGAACTVAPSAAPKANGRDRA
jgi:hypothetical protein